ncbi:unnamed protein product [Urochloa decumbens]|uniref:Uncharacterized protein n=1 Tax=Urochloa decumbens TaxID=240449 RepID=A0ABC8Y7N9_9POAL
MASTTAMMIARAVVVAVLLMQCCNMILAARPLLHAAAAGDGRRGWQPGQGREAPFMQVLNVPGGGNCHGFMDPSHPPCPPHANAVMP